jgi:hypothetical protein
VDTNPATRPRKRKRRWFQFTLRTLFVVVAIMAIACGYVAHEWRTVRERDAIYDRLVSVDRSTISHIVDENGQPLSSVSWIRQLLRDRTIDRIQVPRETSAEECQKIHRAFPEAGPIEFDPEPPK